ncbi:hypothetical protein BV20DRAFT_673261 [Pilatotrama ljubarskyi]|nr:hypothetical protein BV20DRAFT_673261 [Pilatotrama ljubarskyi]
MPRHLRLLGSLINAGFFSFVSSCLALDLRLTSPTSRRPYRFAFVSLLCFDFFRGQVSEAQDPQSHHVEVDVVGAAPETSAQVRVHPSSYSTHGFP